MQPWKIIEETFQHKQTVAIPRGELFMEGKAFFPVPPPNLAGYLDFCAGRGMHLVGLPVGRGEDGPSFQVEDMENLGQESALFLVAVVEGPFQALVSALGLWEALGFLAEKRGEARQRLLEHAQAIKTLLHRCAGRGLRAVALAEDIAYQQGLYFARKTLESLFSPIYWEINAIAREVGLLSLFHSDGKITSAIPSLLEAGFAGLHCQSECQDLLGLNMLYGEKLIFLSCPPDFPAGSLGDQLAWIKMWNGNFILCTSTGVYNKSVAEGLERLYRIL